VPLAHRPSGGAAAAQAGLRRGEPAWWCSPGRGVGQSRVRAGPQRCPAPPAPADGFAMPAEPDRADRADPKS